MYPGRLYRSTNSGDNWDETDISEDRHVGDLAALPNGDVLAATVLGVYRSTDGGGAWDSTNTGLIFGGVSSIVGGRTGLAYAGAYDGIYRSTDGGTTWSFVGLAGMS